MSVCVPSQCFVKDSFMAFKMVCPPPLRATLFLFPGCVFVYKSELHVLCCSIRANIQCPLYWQRFFWHKFYAIRAKQRTWYCYYYVNACNDIRIIANPDNKDVQTHTAVRPPSPIAFFMSTISLVPSTNEFMISPLVDLRCPSECFLTQMTTNKTIHFKSGISMYATVHVQLIDVNFF